MLTIRNTKTGKYINHNEIVIYYPGGNFLFRTMSISQQIDKINNDFFGDDPYYMTDMDQLNNHVNFVVMAIARTYDSTVDRVFKEFFSNCEIVDEEGNIFPIEGNILCGKMKGIVNY